MLPFKLLFVVLSVLSLQITHSLLRIDLSLKYRCLVFTHYFICYSLLLSFLFIPVAQQRRESSSLHDFLCTTPISSSYSLYDIYADFLTYTGVRDIADYESPSFQDKEDINP